VPWLSHWRIKIALKEVMLTWNLFLSTLRSEVLEIVTCKRSLANKPFTLPEGQWVAALPPTCSRLGFVWDGASSEKSIRKQFLNALQQLFGQRQGDLTIDQVVKGFQRFANTNRAPSDSLPPCPDLRIRQAEQTIVQEVIRRCAESGVAASTSSSSLQTSGMSVPVGVVVRRERDVASSSYPRKRLSMSSVSSQQSMPSSVVPYSAGGQHTLVQRVDDETRSASHSYASQASPRGSTDMVVFEEDGRTQAHNSLLVGLPQLPQNLDDLTPTELRRFIVAHQADWLRAANKLVLDDGKKTSGSSKSKRNAGSKKSVRSFQRSIQYWRKKVKANQKQSDEKINQLVKQNELYIKSKRRKKTAFRSHLTVFGGYKLALARNVGHASCASTLCMLEADATHRTSLTRFPVCMGPIKTPKTFTTGKLSKCCWIDWIGTC